ncbi:hypothetical protein [Cytobacillus gottheilii]|uniref:hypothetical protein n=1 Tax=Cytobacillus gottheilii TaxID=859144 RepID=UPI001C58A672|nr:hypothetical protein [Cytobacillus gottheilii]
MKYHEVFSVKRVQVTDEDSPFYGRKGTILQTKRYFNVVQLDDYPYEVNFPDDEIEIIEEEEE